MERIATAIVAIRGQKVMLDEDLASAARALGRSAVVDALRADESDLEPSALLAARVPSVLDTDPEPWSAVLYALDDLPADELDSLFLSL